MFAVVRALQVTADGIFVTAVPPADVVVAIVVARPVI